MSAFATVTRNTLLEHQLFTGIFAFKLFHVSIDVAKNKSMKYHIFHKLANFEQNRMILIIQNLDLLDKNLYIMLSISVMSLAPF